MGNLNQSYVPIKYVCETNLIILAMFFSKINIYVTTKWETQLYLESWPLDRLMRNEKGRQLLLAKEDKQEEDQKKGFPS